MRDHICTCDDCHAEPMDDHCKYADEVAALRGANILLRHAEAERDEADAERIRLHDALYRIAHMSVDPRPDGTFNYSRAAIIEIAREALDG